jgi:peroxin-19
MDLDAILDQALKDFESDGLNERTLPQGRSAPSGQTSMNISPQHMAASLGPTMGNLSKTKQGKEEVDRLFSQLSAETKAEPTDARTKTISLLSESQSADPELSVEKVEQTGEKMMEEMIQRFDELGEREDYDEVMDGVMRQLLSKELMYEPAKLVCERYPEWLVTHKDQLTEERYNNYGRQYQAFQRLVSTYETEPDNYPR